MPENAEIDGGRFFDWGRASQEYAKYRDIYPEEFYQRIVGAGLCVKGQRVLDLGTGTGVLPRNLYRYGAEFVGTDISPQQIGQARALSAAGGMDIAYECVAAEECRYPDGSFDVATACQCFFYFNHQVLAPRLSRMLKPDGRLALLYMAWLPGEDTIAAASESAASFLSFIIYILLPYLRSLPQVLTILCVTLRLELFPGTFSVTVSVTFPITLVSL